MTINYSYFGWWYVVLHPRNAFCGIRATIYGRKLCACLLPPFTHISSQYQVQHSLVSIWQSSWWTRFFLLTLFVQKWTETLGTTNLNHLCFQGRYFWSKGYGFNLHGEKGIHGQFICAVDEGSPAQLNDVRWPLTGVNGYIFKWTDTY